jgi:hypothetical protein
MIEDFMAGRGKLSGDGWEDTAEDDARRRRWRAATFMRPPVILGGRNRLAQANQSLDHHPSGRTEQAILIGSRNMKHQPFRCDAPVAADLGTRSHHDMSKQAIRSEQTRLIVNVGNIRDRIKARHQRQLLGA